MKSHWEFRVGVAVMAVMAVMAVIGISMSVPAIADELDESFKGPHIVREVIPEGFTVLRKFIKKGEPTADGLCLMESRLSVGPNETIEEVELAYDRLTCRSLVVQGRPKQFNGTAGRQLRKQSSGGRSTGKSPGVGASAGSISDFAALFEAG